MTEYQKRKFKRDYSTAILIAGSLLVFALLAGFAGDVTFKELVL